MERTVSDDELISLENKLGPWSLSEFENVFDSQSNETYRYILSMVLNVKDSLSTKEKYLMLMPGGTIFNILVENRYHNPEVSLFKLFKISLAEHSPTLLEYRFIPHLYN